MPDGFPGYTLSAHRSNAESHRCEQLALRQYIGASANMLAVFVGTGVLSLPVSFCKCLNIHMLLDAG